MLSAILISGTLALCSAFNKKRIESQLKIKARQDAMSAAVQIVSYHYAYDIAPGTAVERAKDYANAISSIYTRIIGQYESAYKLQK